MQPQDEQNQDWQAPRATNSAAPFEAPIDESSPEQVSEQAPDDMPEEDSINDRDTADESDEILVRWEATEHVHLERSAGWFIALALVVIALMALSIVMKSITFAILIPVMAATLVIYVKRPPQTNSYTLSRKGLHINDKLYTYGQFKSFGIVQKNEHNSVVLIPRQRFQVDQTVYFPDEVGEAVVDMFAARLPMKDIEPDFIDQLLAKLHL
jgi:hypothetical protein